MDNTGCRIMQRFVEQWYTQVRWLFDGLAQKAGELCCHQFAHFVIERILECGDEDHKSQIAVGLQKQLLLNASNQFGVRCLERAMRCCSPADQYSLASGLDSDQLKSIVDDPFGFFFVKAVVKYVEVSNAHISTVAPDLRAQVEKKAT